jgi:hypothetical protein
VPVKEHGLALLSPCGPSLPLGVGFALDAFFQLNRPDASGRSSFDVSWDSTAPARPIAWARSAGARSTR